jgi:hypothetical protein
VTLVELVTSKYPRTFRLLATSSLQFWIYPPIYGLIAFGCMSGLDALSASGALKLEGTFAANKWLQAISLGIAVKALMHIRIFTVTTDSGSFPVGIESIVQLFEPWMLESIDLDEWQAVRKFVNARLNARYSTWTLQQTQARIRANLPRRLQTNPGFTLDLNACTTTLECMELYLRRCGWSIFDLTFP